MKRKSSIKHGVQHHVIRESSENSTKFISRPSFLGLKNTDGRMIRKSEKETLKVPNSDSGSSDGEEYNIYGKD